MNHQYTTTYDKKRKELERRRLRAGRLFAREATQAEIARALSVSHEAARQWHAAWKQRGMAGLKSAGRPGVKAKLSSTQEQRVVEALLTGPQAFGYQTDFWTLKRIATVTKKVAGVRYTNDRSLWHVLQRLGWSAQKPETQAKERNERAIRRWVREEWPRIKRGP